jgi:transcriptional regulator with GAF, ATPase, and Fis domain
MLRETKGRISGPHDVALRLGLKRSTLLDRMKRLGIDAREIRGSGAHESQVAYSQ